VLNISVKLSTLIANQLTYRQASVTFRWV